MIEKINNNKDYLRFTEAQRFILGYVLLFIIKDRQI